MAGAPPPPAMLPQPLPPARPFHRPILTSILAVLMILGGVLVSLVGVLFLIGGAIFGGLVAGAAGLLAGAAIGAVILVEGIVMLVAGLGLWRLRGWAWWISIFVVVLGIVVWPGLGGKVVFALVLVYLLLVKKHFNQ